MKYIITLLLIIQGLQLMSQNDTGDRAQVQGIVKSGDFPVEYARICKVGTTLCTHSNLNRTP